jgi:beta-glucosidase
VIKVSVDVTNSGSRSGDEVVQLYTHQRTSRDAVPAQQLRAFQRISLQPGQTKTVRFTLRPSDLAHWDVTRNRWVVESSVYDLLVGSSSTDIRQRGSVDVEGETIPPRDLSTPTRAQNFDAHHNLDLVDTTKQRGTSVASTQSAGWAEYAKAVVGATTFTAKVAKETAGTGSIQVRLDSPDGPLLGTTVVASTGDKYAYEKATVSLRAVRGVRDVYLVMSPGLRLASFSIS